MLLQDAKLLAMEHMEVHGLLDKGWTFEFDNTKVRFGVCRYRTKRIGLSKHLVLLNNETQVLDTILHEIAHALVGQGHGHNHVWRAKALEIGCNGKRCYDSKTVSKPRGKYEAVCQNCQHVFVKHKAPKFGKSMSCGYCSKGYYNPVFRLIFVKTT